jgi:hypothetical protein
VKKESGSVVKMEDVLDPDESSSKGTLKGRKRPTNKANLPKVVKDNIHFFNSVILRAYRAYIACSKEVWVVQDGTALRYLQIIWDFHANENQVHKFTLHDPILPLVSTSMTMGYRLIITIFFS